MRLKQWADNPPANSYFKDEDEGKLLSPNGTIFGSKHDSTKI